MSQSGADNGATAPVDIAALLANDAAGHWMLDPAGSRVEFQVKHFWGAITVRGSFGQLAGEADVGVNGDITGRLSIGAASLSTKNKKRDEHLRSADFFDVEHHPQVIVTLTAAEPSGPGVLAGQGTLEAAGHIESIAVRAHIDEVSERAVVVRAELMIDRIKFAMTWSPLRMASHMARGIVVARFVRS